MADQNDNPTAELLATGGLVTMMGSVMAAVIAVVALGEGSVATAGVLGGVAMISFAASLVLFTFDSRRSQGDPLPFPSWMRTDSETAAELSL